MIREREINDSSAGLTVAVALFTSVLGLAGVAAAQGSGVLRSGTVEKVEVAVWTAPGNDETAQLDLGDTHQLKAGESVRLRLFVPRGKGPGNQRHYLSGRWHVAAGRDVVEIVESDREKGSVTLKATRGGTAELRYELEGAVKVTRPYMAKSAIQLRVAGGHGSGSPTPAPGSPAATKAEAVVRHLYQGILLREPDAANDRWVKIVLKDGYDGVIDIAYEIAESRESQYKVGRERGYSNRDRLLAIYRHLLDLEEGKIDKYQWQDHMAMIDDGELTGVVMDIVRSPEFRRVHAFNEGI